MSFTDTGEVGELHLRSSISIKDDDGKWIKGKVVELALLGDDMLLHRVGLQTENGTVIWLDRTPATMTILEWD